MISVTLKISSGGPDEVRAMEVEPGMTYYDLLRIAGINPETVVILSNGVPIPGDDLVAPGEISVWRVVSAG
ncbi:MAG: MoaD/ThiS family protein [Methanotrichaceae archaeon]|nr:MoaD/ThiS family protein [Methanotrichaceae archaeon]